ncbi:hypothetical protein EAE99_004491 [Botrytis elliptica]|nr:hypothetical protein EAE99_004491 [Botrytis elliptica]
MSIQIQISVRVPKGYQPETLRLPGLVKQRKTMTGKEKHQTSQLYEEGRERIHFISARPPQNSNSRAMRSK